MHSRTTAFLSTLLLTVIFLLTSGCSGAPSPTERLERARLAMENNELDSAILDLKQLVRDNPDDGEARLLLGIVHLELDDPISAEKELLRAKQLGADEEKVYPALGSALLESRKYEEVTALSPLKPLSDASQSALLISQAKAHLALGQTESASLLVDAALPLAPDSVDAKTTEAAILAIEDAAAARTLLAEILEESPTYSAAWSQLGMLERRSGNLEAAEEAISSAISNGSGIRDVLSRALVRIQLDKLDSALADIEEAKTLAPNYHEIYFLEGILHYKNGDLAAAKSSLDLAHRADNKFFPTRIYLAEVNYKLGNIAQAEALTSGYLSENAEYAPANKLYAAILLQSGRYQEAESLAGFAMDRLPQDYQLHAILAAALRAQGDRASEIEVLRKMLLLEPDRLAATSQLGSAYLATGEEEKGIDLLETALEKDPTSVISAREMVAYYSRQGKGAKAIEIATDFQKNNEDLVDAHNILGLAYLGDAQLSLAKEAFDRAAILSPGNPFAKQSIAAMALRSGDYESARENYNEVLVHNPYHLQTMLKLAALDQIQGRPDDVIERLETAILKHPESATPRIHLARHYLTTGEPEKVASFLSEVLQKDSDNTLALELMGRAELAQKDFAKAVFSFQQLADLKPQYANANFLLSQAYAGMQDRKKVLEQLNSTLQKNPNHFLSRLNLAQLMYNQENFVEARKHVNTLKTLAPDNPDIKYLEALLAKSSGNETEARALFNEVFDSAKNSKSVISVAQQEWDMGDKEIAVSRLSKWLDANPSDANVHLYLAKFYTEMNNIPASIEHYKKVLANSGSSVVALNNLAWNLRDSDPVAALQYAERANGIAPSSPYIADTLAVVLWKNDNARRAIQASDRATSGTTVVDGNQTMFFHKAQILESLGESEKAIEVLKGLLASPQRFPEQVEAESTLARLQSK